MTLKKYKDIRRFYPNSHTMKDTYKRLKWMCQNPGYTQHSINRRHVLCLDDAVWIQFAWDKHSGVQLHVELTRHGKPTRDGLIRWWPVIEQWWQVLMDLHGPWKGGGLSRLIHGDLRFKRRQGASYAQLAGWLNRLIRHDLQNPRSKYKSFAPQILNYFSPKTEFESVVKNRGHITDLFPITAADVRERLRYLGYDGPKSPR